MEIVAVGRIKKRKGEVANEWIKYRDGNNVVLELQSHYQHTGRTFTLKEVTPCTEMKK